MIAEYSYQNDICVKQYEAWQESRQEGEARGIIDAGFDFGLSKQDILSRLQSKLHVSLKKAQEYFEMFEKR